MFPQMINIYKKNTHFNKISYFLADATHNSYTLKLGNSIFEKHFFQI